MDAIYADERKMECYVVAKAIDDGLVNTIQYDWLLEHMDGKYRKKKWRDYIVNYLLIFYCCRNMDTHCVIVNENDFTDKHKDDNFLVIMNDGRIQWIRDNYKTNRTIEALTYIIDDPKFFDSVIELQRETAYTFSNGEDRMDNRSVGRCVQNATYNFVGQQIYFDIVRKHFKKDIERLTYLSKSRPVCMRSMVY